MSAPRFPVYLPSCNKGKHPAEAVEGVSRRPPAADAVAAVWGGMAGGAR